MTASLVRLTGINSALALKAPVRCATTVPITLSGLQTIDGVTFQQSDVAFPNSGTNKRVLVKNQIDTTTNGIYDVNVAAWTRSADFDGNDDAVQGTRVQVAQGNSQQGVWILATPDPVYLTNSGSGVSGITFVQQTLVITAIGTISSVAGVTQVIGTPGSVNQVITTRAYATEGDGGGGTFVWSANNHATDVTNDPQHGLFIPPSSDLTGASGAWVRQYTGLLNAAWFGGLTQNASDATTKTNNTTTIQAAIDASYAFGLGVARIPAGLYYCNPQIFLDPPGNLRANINAPNNYNFSLALEGDAGMGAHNLTGTRLLFTDNTKQAIIVGPGQGMRLTGLNVQGPTGVSRAAMNTAGGIGVAISGGDGGASRTLIDRCLIENFGAGVMTGFNRDSLSDAFCLRDSQVANCYYGVNFSKSQNYINQIINAVIQDCKYFLYNALSKDVTVLGGNFSGTTAQAKALGITSVSTLSDLSDNYQGQVFTNESFTVTLTAASTPMTDGTFDTFCIKTTGYGLVPLSLTSYNSSTLVATFKLSPAWVLTQGAGNFVQTNYRTQTDLQTELQAATTLYACERFTTFSGPGYIVSGTHIENPGCVTTLLDANAGFAGSKRTKLSGLLFNYLIDQSSYAGGTPDQLAIFYNQQAWPFIRGVQSSSIYLDDASIGASLTTDSVVIENFPTAVPLVSCNNDWPPPNLWIPGSGTEVPAFFGNWSSMSRGHGEWDYTPFLPRGVPNSITTFYGANGQMETPFQGWVPHRSMHPRLTPSQLTTLSGVLPAITNGNYPPLNGETIYSVIDFNSGGLAKLWARSAHIGFSWGQNLTINWSYKAKSNVVALSDTTKMFAGLMIGLDNGGGNQNYMVTGVYPTLGYITVAGALAGTIGTTYTGATVNQQAYSITQY